MTHLICILFEEMSWNGFLSQLLFVPVRRCVLEFLFLGIRIVFLLVGGKHNDFEL